MGAFLLIQLLKMTGGVLTMELSLWLYHLDKLSVNWTGSFSLKSNSTRISEAKGIRLKGIYTALWSQLLFNIHLSLASWHVPRWKDIMLELVQTCRSNDCCPKDLKDWNHKELGKGRTPLEWSYKTTCIVFSAKCIDITKSRVPVCSVIFQLQDGADSPLLNMQWLKK